MNGNLMNEPASSLSTTESKPQNYQNLTAIPSIMILYVINSNGKPNMQKDCILLAMQTLGNLQD